MATLFVRHKVEDYDRWRSGSDENVDYRTEHAVTADAVYRSPEDPSEVTVTHDFDSAEAARAFSDDPWLANRMREVGVTGEPEVWIAERA